MNKPNKDELWKELVELINVNCEVNNIKPTHIANEIGVSPSTVTRILGMQFCPKSDILFKMAKAVNIKINFKNE